MKYFSKANIYKNSTGSCLFFPDRIEAVSYNWWSFVKVFNGKVVFNSFTYSNTTSKHQSNVRSLLSQLGIKIDLEIECPAGLQSRDAEVSVSQHYSAKIRQLQAEIDKPRSQERKNMERKQLIAQHAANCVAFKLLFEEHTKAA